jgi:hypothetical protein
MVISSIIAMDRQVVRRRWGDNGTIAKADSTVNRIARDSIDSNKKECRHSKTVVSEGCLAGPGPLSGSRPAIGHQLPTATEILYSSIDKVILAEELTGGAI